MENLGMFSDAYPACPFPKSFSFNIKKIGEPIKTTSALPDSTEDIKMFDSPERDSEDFERSLKKTMECIAQVCDTTVPDPSNTPQKPTSDLDSSLLKPLNNPLQTPLKPPPPNPEPHKLPPYLDTTQTVLSPTNHIIENIAREETVGVGPILASKKFHTPPHHPYQRPGKRSRTDREGELEARESWERRQREHPVQGENQVYQSDSEKKQQPPQSGGCSDLKHSQYTVSDPEKNPPLYENLSDLTRKPYNVTEPDRKLPHIPTQPAVSHHQLDTRNHTHPGPHHRNNPDQTGFPQRTNPSADHHPGLSQRANPNTGHPGPQQRINPDPQHFIFPDCSNDLQKEFFMFYMQRCLQQNMVDPPPYSAHGGPSTSMMTSQSGNMTSQPSMMTSQNGVMTSQHASPLHQERRFVDSTTSPINPRFLLENKENCSPAPHPSHLPPDMNCNYNSPPVPGPGPEVKQQTLHFNFPSPVPPADHSIHPPHQTPNPATPIMGPSLDQSVLGPSPGFYNRADTADFNRGSMTENSRQPHSERSRLENHHVKLPVSLAENSRLPVSTDLSSIRPTLQNEQNKCQDNTREERSPHSPAPRAPPQFRDNPDRTTRDMTSRDMVPPGKVTCPTQQQLPQGGRPPNLPSHLFPNDTRPLQFHTPPPSRGFQPPLPPAPRSANLPLHSVRQDFIQPPGSALPRIKQEPLPQLDMGYFDPGRAGLSRNSAPLDKAIPDNLAAGYMPYIDRYPDMLNKPFTPGGDFFSHSSAKERFNFSFKETIGKMLSKKKNNAAADTNPTGKRTKFTNEQIRVLEHYYHNINKYVTGTNKGTLCQVTGLELSTILMWFQNKRAREKKQKTNV